MTNKTGLTIEEESDFYPFGGERTVTDTLANQSYKFTGKERDGETNLDYFGARYYSSNFGRFVTPDEFAGGPVDAFSSGDPAPPGPLPYADITDPQSLNKYTYTYNNPLRYTDPDGHETQATLDPEEAREAGTTIAGALKGAWNLVAGTWNFGAELVNAQGEAGGRPFKHVPLLPTASYDSSGEAISGAITQIGIVVYSGIRGASGAKTGEGNTGTPKEGIYEGADATAPGKSYIGQSGDVPNRLSQQKAGGRFPAGTEVKVTEVKGGKTAREVAEHKRIQELGGVKSKAGSQTSNIRNPIGTKRKHLLKE